MVDEATPDADEAKAKSAAKWVTIVGAALIGLIVPAITAYQFAASEARAAAAKIAATAVEASAKAKVEGQATKNEAEAGYQVTRQAMEALEHRVLVLEHAKSHRRARPPAPNPLPTDLKKAEAVVFGPAPAPPVAAPPPARTPDASP